MGTKDSRLLQGRRCGAADAAPQRARVAQAVGDVPALALF
jgi:hypothetical protein